MQVSITQAKNRLSELLKAVENGEQVTVCRRGVPVVDLVGAEKPEKKKLQLGTLRDRIVIHDPDWWKPMTDEDVEAFLNGTYGISARFGPGLIGRSDCDL